MGRFSNGRNARTECRSSATQRQLRGAAALLFFCAGVSHAGDFDCSDDVCIEVERTDRGATFFAVNRHAAPVSLQLDFSVLENMSSSAALPVKSVISPRARKQLVAIRAKNPDKSYRWRWRWRWTTGVLGARHDKRARYWVPWASNLRFEVGQAVGGTFTHSGNWRFAFDFRTPVGTPIRAARGGTVVRVIENFRRGGTDKRFKKRANLIFILHSDGTIARYLHLKFEGAQVSVGDVVEAGDLIGFSGNTGFSQNPHLHFDVFRVDEKLDWQTVDIRFADDASAGFRPESGQILNGGARQFAANR